MDNNNPNIESVNKFESMLKTNSLLFFDSNEFEEITMYYIDELGLQSGHQSKAYVVLKKWINKNLI